MKSCSRILSNIEAYSGIIGEYGVIIRHVWTLRNPCIYNRAIFRTLAYLEPKTSSEACQTCKMIIHYRSPGIVRTVYSSIFRDIDAYSATLPAAQLGGKGMYPLSFIENRKKCPDFGKKVSIMSIIGLRFLFKMYFQGYLGEKLQNIFLGASFSCVFDEMFIEVY